MIEILSGVGVHGLGVAAMVATVADRIYNCIDSALNRDSRKRPTRGLYDPNGVAVLEQIRLQ